MLPYLLMMGYWDTPRSLHDGIPPLPPAQGVANRDLKLENLLLDQDQSSGNPLLKICDFGARARCAVLRRWAGLPWPALPCPALDCPGLTRRPCPGSRMAE